MPFFGTIQTTVLVTTGKAADSSTNSIRAVSIASAPWLIRARHGTAGGSFLPRLPKWPVEEPKKYRLA